MPRRHPRPGRGGRRAPRQAASEEQRPDWEWSDTTRWPHIIIPLAHSHPLPDLLYKMPFKLSIVNLDPWEGKISQFYREFCSHRDKITFIWEGGKGFWKLMDLLFYSISWLIKAQLEEIEAWLSLHNMVKIQKIFLLLMHCTYTLSLAPSYGPQIQPVSLAGWLKTY